MSNTKTAILVKGFTLVEVIVAVAIFSLIIGTFASLFVLFFKNYNFTVEQGKTIEEAKLSVQKFGSELREARTSQDGAYPLVITNDQEVAFYSDVDNDGQVEKVRYYLDGNSFYRGVVEPGTPPVVYDSNTETIRMISDKVENETQPLFLYYNSDWPGDQINNPLVQAQRLLDTRMIRLELLINTDVNQQSDFEITSQTMIRNLKIN